jgi:PPM family protein phosphatase
MSNLIFLSPSGGNEQVRGALRQIVAFPSLEDPVILSPQGQRFALATTQGNVRERNEDRAAVVRVTDSSGGQPWLLYIVCDGMGGMADGAKAAEIALSTFVSAALEGRLGSTDQNLASAATAANRAVYAQFRGGGGATLSAVGWDSLNLVTVNVGDSRIWALEKSGRCVQWTRDDSIAAQLEAQGVDGAIDARRDLLQFVGVGDDFSPHVDTREFSEIRSIAITTDGAHDAPNSVFYRIFHHSRAPRETVTRLIQLSLWSGGLDNATVVSADLAPVIGAVVGTVEVWTPAGYWRIVRSPSGNMPEKIPAVSADQQRSGEGPQSNKLSEQAAAARSDGGYKPTRDRSQNKRGKRKRDQMSLLDEQGTPASSTPISSPTTGSPRVHVQIGDEVERGPQQDRHMGSLADSAAEEHSGSLNAGFSTAVIIKGSAVDLDNGAGECKEAGLLGTTSSLCGNGGEV